MLKEPHNLKTWPGLFKQLWLGEKDFEYRFNDRDFYEGDELQLREYDPMREKYTGRWIRAYVLKIWGIGWTEMPGLPDEFVIMKIEVADRMHSEGITKK